MVVRIIIARLQIQPELRHVSSASVELRVSVISSGLTPANSASPCVFAAATRWVQFPRISSYDTAPCCCNRDTGRIACSAPFAGAGLTCPLFRLTTVRSVVNSSRTAIQKSSSPRDFFGGRPVAEAGRSGMHSSLLRLRPRIENTGVDSCVTLPFCDAPSYRERRRQVPINLPPGGAYCRPKQYRLLS